MGWVGWPTLWYTLDWDQRRYITISVPDEVDMDEHQATALGAFVSLLDLDGLNVDVCLIDLSMQGDLLTASSEQELDPVIFAFHCPFTMISEKHQLTHSICTSELIEFDRLGRGVDLISYKSAPQSKAVFKCILHVHMVVRQWHELNCRMRISAHPSIVP